MEASGFTLRPVFFTYKVLGLLTFKFKNRELERVPWASCYKICAYVLSLGYLVGATLIDKWYSVTDSDGMIHYLYVMETYGRKAICLVALLCNEIYGEVLMEAWKGIILTDNFLRQLRVGGDDKDITRLSVALILAGIALSGASYTVQGVSKGEDVFYLVSVVYFVGYCYMTLNQICFSAHAILLTRKFQYLACFAENKVSVKTIRKAAEAYQILYDVNCAINEAYSMPLLLNMGSNFYMVVTQAFGLFDVIYNGGYEIVSLMVFLSILVSHCFILLVVIGSSGFLADSVYVLLCPFIIWGLRYCFRTAASCKNSPLDDNAESIKQTLIKAMSAEYDPAIRKEINAFALQLLHYQVKVSAGGFFDIDFTLIYSIVGAISTYLIILVQFDLAT